MHDLEVMNKERERERESKKVDVESLYVINESFD